MKPNIFDVIPKLFDLRRKKQERLKNRARIDCLFEKFYAFDPDIKIPYPNLFADTLIRQRFGESMNMGDIKTVIEILYILENQQDPTLAHQSKEERENAVNKKMIGIKAEAKEKYQMALNEMFTALKKNSNQRILSVLEQSKQILDQLENQPLQ